MKRRKRPPTEYEQWKASAPTRDELQRLWHKLAAERDRLTPELWRELKSAAVVGNGEA